VTPAEITAEVARRLPGQARCEADGAEAGGATVTLDVQPGHWLAAMSFARDVAGCTFFDWLTAVDERDAGFAVVAHLYSIEGKHHLILRTLVPREAPLLASATAIFRGAGWAERETTEMFGVVFEGHPDPAPLLLPEGFEGHPLRKDFALTARVEKEWPGGKEPGEREASARSRRRLRPPGIPNDWRER
jgi:NADH-quinone oxidoreductase subunit C